MFCRQVQKELISYIKDLLSPDIKARVEAHLSKCPKCEQKAAELRETLEFYQKGEEIEPSADFDFVLAQKIESQKIGLERFSEREQLTADYFRPSWVFGAIAVAAVIIAVFFLPQLIKKESPDIQIAQTDIKQVFDQDVSVKTKVRDNQYLELLRAQEPFLPASNIELNVLPKRENVQLTIYNSADLTLVREQRNLTLKKGWNWLQFMWANTLIDPTSLSLEPLEYKDKVEVQALVFPPRIRELGRWLIFSEVSGEVPVEITYLTSGLSWRAFYTGTLDSAEEKMHLKGYVRAINNSGEDYEDAQTRLIVGKVHMLDKIADLAKRQYAYGRQRIRIDADLTDNVSISNQLIDETIDLGSISISASFQYSLKDIKKEGLSEYFLYTIEGTETIPDGWAKRLPSLETEGIPVISLYKYDEERWGNHPVRFVSFTNDTKHNLGETPLPDGKISIYRNLDKEKHLAYIGAADVKYIPVDEEVELNLGPARQVTIEPKLMDLRTANYLYNNRGNVAGWDEVRTWKMEVKNTRQIPVKMEITRSFKTAYWKLETGAGNGYAKHDMTHARFTVEIPAAATKNIEYTVTTYHGTRESNYR